MVCVRMREQHRVDAGNPAVQQLAAHVRRRIDQQPLPIVALDQDRGAAAAVAWFRRIAGAPVAAAVSSANHRHAGRGAGAQQRDLHAAFRNSRRKFAVVTLAMAPGVRPWISARTEAVCTTQAGSLRLPRNGTGAKYGASVSTSRRSTGTSRAMSRSSWDLGKVRMPE